MLDDSSLDTLPNSGTTMSIANDNASMASKQHSLDNTTMKSLKQKTNSIYGTLPESTIYSARHTMSKRTTNFDSTKKSFKIDQYGIIQTIK